MVYGDKRYMRKKNVLHSLKNSNIIKKNKSYTLGEIFPNTAYLAKDSNLWILIIKKASNLTENGLKS